jgi:putative tricarboxylic transport membrane protein
MPSLGHAETPDASKIIRIVIPFAPGGSNDKTGRTVEKILSEKKLVPSTITVNNKPGGGGNISLTYVSQKVGDAHFLAVATPSLLTNHIVGQGSLNYTDFTPVASLFNDYIVFAVNPDSPIKTGRDLVERLKKDPKSISIGFATALGSHNHIGAGLLMKAIGGEAKALKAIAFKGSAEAITALLGGHMQLLVAEPQEIGEYVRRGSLRPLAQIATHRLASYPDVPTMAEAGFKVRSDPTARGVVAPPGISREALAYWENVFARLVKSPEWRKYLEENQFEDGFQRGEDTMKSSREFGEQVRGMLRDAGLKVYR